MTREEVKRICDLMWQMDFSNGDIEKVRNALEKQIPIKGKIIVEGKPENGGSYGVRACPSCGKRIDVYGDYIGCPYCLQRADWSEEE